LVFVERSALPVLGQELILADFVRRFGQAHRLTLPPRVCPPGGASFKAGGSATPLAHREEGCR
jgi:hypothetical protein